MELRKAKRKRQWLIKRVARTILFCLLIITVILIICNLVSGIAKTHEKLSDLTVETNADSQYIQNEEKIASRQADELTELCTDEYTDTFTITYYCPCEKCCGKADGITATGTKATEGRTVGVDPNVIPLGSELIIDGQAYIAEDTGNIQGKTIDVFVDSHERALELGRVAKEVVVKGI